MAPVQQPQPIIVIDLFPEVLDALSDLLSGLPADAWEQPTAAPGWTVKDIALHLLQVDLSQLSGKRDGYDPVEATVENWDDLVRYINWLNERWVTAMRRTSPRLLRDLLRFTGDQVSDFFRTRDLRALGGPVDWAGPSPAPVWLDLAREYTERWHHQQQIREAVGKPGLREPRYFAPVLDAFVRALPHTYRQVAAPAGTLVALTLTGDSGGRWSVRREAGQWALYVGAEPSAQAEVVLDQISAWQLFTKGLSPEEARTRATIRGSEELGKKVLETVSIIA